MNIRSSEPLKRFPDCFRARKLMPADLESFGMKTEELNALKEEVEILNKNLAELNAEVLAQVSGGTGTVGSSMATVVGCDAVNLRDAPGMGKSIRMIRRTEANKGTPDAKKLMQ